MQGVATNVVVDQTRRQVNVCVPYAAFDPRTQGTARVSMGVGLGIPLREPTSSRKLPLTRRIPAEKGTSQIRRPFLTWPSASVSRSPGPNASFSVSPSSLQGTTLQMGDLTPFSTVVKFQALLSGTMMTCLGAARRCSANGLHESHFGEPLRAGAGQRKRNNASTRSLSCSRMSAALLCRPTRAVRNLCPVKPQPANGYGIWINPHAAGGNQNNYSSLASQWQIEGGERGNGYIMYTPNARGLAYWYYGQSGAEVFEIWADIAQYYKLDPTQSIIGGLSMGGYATWKLGGQFPDLFAAAPMIVPCPSAGTGYNWFTPTNVPGGVDSLNRLLAPSFRNVPQYIWTGNRDTTCTYLYQAQYVKQLDAASYRYQWFTFPVGHAYPLGNEFAPMMQWLNTQGSVVVNPPHITYVLNGEMNEPTYGLNADHAYWISGLTLRNASVVPPIGQIDVKSRGFGTGDPPVTPLDNESGQFATPTGPITYTVQSRGWGTAATTPRQDVIDIVAQNVSTVTINPSRANVDCDVQLNVTSDGPLLVSFFGCTRSPEQH